MQILQTTTTSYVKLNGNKIYEFIYGSHQCLFQDMQLSKTEDVVSILFFFFFTVIGGKNVYLRLSVNGECDNKASIWETLKKEVPWCHHNGC